jgi:hypothetical protein
MIPKISSPQRVTVIKIKSAIPRKQSVKLQHCKTGVQLDSSQSAELQVNINKPYLFKRLKLRSGDIKKLFFY